MIRYKATRIRYNPEPLKISDAKGSMITAKNANRTITRNSSHFKILPSTVKLPVQEEISYPALPISQTLMNKHLDTSMESETHCNEQMDTSDNTRHRYPQRGRRPPIKFKDYVKM